MFIAALSTIATIWKELKLTTQETTDGGEDVEKEDLFCTAGGNANWCSHSRKQYGGSSKS